jgi:hypothetical protein
MVGACGVIAIDTSAAGLTVRVTVADTPSKVMRIVVVPTPLLMARPCLPAELLIVATLPSLEVQWPASVTVCVLPSE